MRLTNQVEWFKEELYAVTDALVNFITPLNYVSVLNHRWSGLRRSCTRSLTHSSI